MRPGVVHHAIRAVTRHAPYLEIETGLFGRRVILDDLNIVLGRLFFDRPEPLWLVSEPVGPTPALELNVSMRLQRKVFYFAGAWGRHWLESPLAAYMKQTLGPGSIFVDIGANLGIYSLYAARLVGNEGAVVAFEPEADIFESLVRSVRLNGCERVRCEPVALSDRNAEGTLYVSFHGGANSLVGAAGRYKGEMPVTVRRLDDHADTLGIDLARIALMKIDVEGEEARTVAGMLETLRRAACPPLWVEVRGPRGSTRAPDTFAAVDDRLAPLGYRAHRWKKGAAVPVTRAEVSGREDILFLAEAPSRGSSRSSSG
jgi:FkbM family methyltransferase